MNLLIATITLFFLLAIQSNSHSQVRIVKDNIACLYGLKNEKGEWVVPAEYTLIKETENWKNYTLLKNNKYGLADYYGKITIEPIYERLYPLSYTRKYFLVLSDGLQGVVDFKNKILVPLEYISIQWITNNLFLCVDKKGRENFRDTIGFIHKNKFKNLSRLPDNYGNGPKLILTDKKTGFHGIFSTSFDTLLDLSKCHIEERGWNYLIRKDSLVAITDQMLNIIFPFKYSDFKFDYYNHFQNWDTLAFKENEKWGICHANGEVLCEAKFDDLLVYEDGNKIRWKAIINGKQGYIDHFGNELLPIVYGEIKHYDISDGKYKLMDFYQVEKDGLFGLYDQSLNVRLKPKYNLHFPNEYNVRYFSDSTETYGFKLRDDRVYNSFNPKLVKGELKWKFPKYDIFKFDYSDKSAFEYHAFEKINGMYEIKAFHHINLIGDKIVIRFNNINRYYDLQGNEIFDPLANKDLIGIGDSLYIYQTKNNRMGIINSKAQTVIDTTYKFILQAYNYNTKQMMIWTKEFQNTNCTFNDSEACGWRLRDLTGKILSEIEFDFPVKTNTIGRFYSNGKAGFFDFINMSPVIEPEYLIVAPIFENEIFQFGLNKDSTFHVFKPDGTLLSETKWNYIFRFPQKMDFTKNIYTGKILDPYDRTEIHYITAALINVTDTLLIDENGNSTNDKNKIHKAFTKGMQVLRFDYNTHQSGFTSREKSTIKDSMMIDDVMNYFYDRYPEFYRYRPLSGSVTCLFYLPNYKYIYPDRQKHFTIGKPENKGNLVCEFVYTESNYACIKTSENYRTINLKKHNGELQEFNADSLFRKEINTNDVMTLLIADFIYGKDDIFLDCMNPASLFEITGKQFTFDENAIYLTIRDQYGYNIEISIPWKKLLKYAPEKGIVADFISAGKK